MAFGPEFLRGLAASLNGRLPWRVSRVEGGESWIALKVSYQDQWLLLSWAAGAAGCCLASGGEVAALREGAPARAPLAEALRSRITRGDILSARQLQEDRLLELTLRRRVAAGTLVGYSLILEATEPVANLLLLDANGRIEEAARHSAPDQNHYRTLLPGHPYVPPPAFKGPSPRDLSVLTFDEVPTLAGIGRPLAKRIQSRWEERSPEEWLSALKDACSDAVLPCWAEGKNYLTRFAFPPSDAPSLGEDPLAAASHGVLRPMLQRGRERQLREADARLKRAIKARERHRDGLLKQLQDCETAEVLRRKGEALLSHLAEIPPRADLVRLTDWEGQTLEIALDPHLSPSRNAERYFKKYRRAKGDPQALREGLRALEGAIQELTEQHDLLESIEDPEAFEEAVRDLDEWLPDPARGGRQAARRARKQPAPPHQRFEMEGLTILLGLSARGNRHVTFREARGEDIWLHAHELPGSHVIVRGARRAELEGEHRAVLEFAAALAAGHSRGRNSGSVLVDYTERRYVRPVPGTVALVTYTNPGTLRVAPKSVRTLQTLENPAKLTGR